MRDETIEDFCKRKDMPVSEFENWLNKTIVDLEDELIDTIKGKKG